MKTKMSSFSLGNGRSGSGDIPTKQIENNDEDVESRIAIIEPRLLPVNEGTASEDDVLSLDANLRPKWTPSSANLPVGVKEGDILVWDLLLGKWKIFSSDDDVVRVRASDGTWHDIKIPVETGMIMISQTVTGEPPVKFDFPTYTA